MSSETQTQLAALIRRSRELDSREKDILIRRLRTETLSRIGRRYKITGERIRQIENSALDKLFGKTTQLHLFD
ncbi:hypothetical protein A2Z33_07390 [Candidatus Gottesmanbacteria bacterium RBG_16_52_11]|uniref:RNA polymerase sigma-70 region 4 domain-containing protein n=1 Tax=Candidatus Gottesmanbacteria bacterium RBG_16_52_11 TaxID=1798374 RepID=A0A1F5YY63_9BACT|nr:MAG: hypothetical protein A2Z33_07390 [Candidatus Gottesmanbacteria bacterium RBG_16_52_11]